MKFLLSHSHSDTKTLLGVFTQSGVSEESRVYCLHDYEILRLVPQDDITKHLCLSIQSCWYAPAPHRF